MKPWTNKSLSFGIIGLLLVALGVAICFLRSTIFHQIIQKGLALTPTSSSFEVWQDTSSLPPMRLEIYFFNWTNPQELGKRGKKPHFVQVGPYTYTEVRVKDNVTFFPENKTVSYLQRRIWHFDEKHTNGSLNDTLIHLNVVATSAAHKIRYWSSTMQRSLSFILTTSRLYVIKTVDELLFKGYDDTLITMGKMMSVEDAPTYDRFGWFYMRNNSYELDGHYNMETGEDDISRLGVMRKWNYKDTTKYFKSPCNVIEGSAGQFWPPSRTKDDISLFSTDVCRPIIYEYERTTSYMGIEGYRYSVDKKTLGNATKRRYPHEQAKFFEPTTTTEDFFATEHSNEDAGFSMTTNTYESNENSSTNVKEDAEKNQLNDDDPDIVNMGQCYCNGECTPSGLINITSCRFGAPVFISLPHFYKADPILLNQVEGLSPNEKDHSFTITLEPNTGIPLEIHARLQVNILLQPSESVSLFSDVPKTYIPIFWFNINVQLTEEMTSKVKTLLVLPTVMLCSGIIMAIVGLCLIGIMIFLHFRNKQPIPPTNNVVEKMVEESPDKKTETVYMDKISANEDANVRSDRRLYTKLY